MNDSRGLQLPELLAEKANQFPEYRMGSNKVSLMLKDGRCIRDVFLAWGQTIVKIGEEDIKNPEDLFFRVSEIEDVKSEI